MGDSLLTKREGGFGPEGYNYFQSWLSWQVEVKSISAGWTLMGKGPGVQIRWMEGIG